MSHDDFSHAIYYDVWCKKPWNGRIVAFGDAVHGTSPQLGQGVTMALLDAKALTSMINSHDNCETAYKGFWAERKGQLLFVRWASRLLTPLFQSNSRIIGWVRDITLHPGTKWSLGKKIALETLTSKRTSIFK